MAVQETEFTDNGFVRRQNGKSVTFYKVEYVLNNANIMKNTDIVNMKNTDIANIINNTDIARNEKMKNSQI